MKTLSLALAVATTAAIAFAPLTANAAQQTTSTQSEFKSSVKAQPMTHKRHQIIRSESSHGQTTGEAPHGISR
jgi:hypothetical protein